MIAEICLPFNPNFRLNGFVSCIAMATLDQDVIQNTHTRRRKWIRQVMGYRYLGTGRQKCCHVCLQIPRSTKTSDVLAAPYKIELAAAATHGQGCWETGDEMVWTIQDISQFVNTCVQWLCDNQIALEVISICLVFNGL